jgi:hypothetical protein
MTQYSRIGHSTEYVEHEDKEYKIVVEIYNTDRVGILKDKRVRVSLYRLKKHLWGLYSTKKKVLSDHEECSTKSMGATASRLKSIAKRKARENAEAMTKVG